MLQLLPHTLHQRPFALCRDKRAESHAVMTIHASIKQVCIAVDLVVFIIRHRSTRAFTGGNSCSSSLHKKLKLGCSRAMITTITEKKTLPVKLCSDCSISQQAITASMACTRTCCCSCSLKEQSNKT